MFADLHLHSNYSDGTYTPEEVAMHGSRYDLGVLALTDHDTVEGCEEMAAACARQGIEFVAGSELTAELNQNELHMLAYFLDTTNAALLEAMGKFQNVRQNRICEMVERLNKLNVPLEAEAVFKIASCRSPGRPHVGRALVQGGFCKTLDEAFERYLKKHRPAWVPKFKISAVEAIELIHCAGGVAVMAHPGLNRSDDLIPELAEAGLDGLECYHTKHPPATVEHYLELAETHGFLVTGGSDCHGMNKGKPLIGKIKLPYEHVRDLKRRSEEIRQGLDPVSTQE